MLTKQSTETTLIIIVGLVAIALGILIATTSGLVFPLILIGLFFGIGCITIIYLYPKIGWVAFAFFVPLGLTLRIPIGGFQVAPSIPLLLVLIIAALVERKKRIDRYNKINLTIWFGLFLYIFIDLLGLLYANDPSWGINLLIKIIFGIVVYVSFVKIFPKNFLGEFIQLVILGTVIFVTASIFYYIVILNLDYISSTFRSDLGQEGRNEFALLLSFVTPFALSNFLLSPMGNKKRILVGIASLILVAGIALLLSRSSYLTLLVSMVWVLYWSGKLRFSLLKLLPIVLSILLVYLFIAQSADTSLIDQVIGRFASVGEVFGFNVDTRGASSGESVRIRKELSSWAFSLWKQSPVWGIGTGDFWIRMQQERLDLPTHNEYLRWLVEHGILGLFLLVLLPLNHAVKSIGYLRSRSTIFPRWVVVGVSGSLIAVLVHSFFININSHLFYWLALGLTGKIILYVGSNNGLLSETT